MANYTSAKVQGPNPKEMLDEPEEVKQAAPLPGLTDEEFAALPDRDWETHFCIAVSITSHTSLSGG